MAYATMCRKKPKKWHPFSIDSRESSDLACCVAEREGCCSGGQRGRCPEIKMPALRPAEVLLSFHLVFTALSHSWTGQVRPAGCRRGLSFRRNFLTTNFS